jgi:hypothetical protein
MGQPLLMRLLRHLPLLDKNPTLGENKFEHQQNELLIFPD